MPKTPRSPKPTTRQGPILVPSGKARGSSASSLSASMEVRAYLTGCAACTSSVRYSAQQAGLVRVGPGDGLAPRAAVQIEQQDARLGVALQVELHLHVPLLRGDVAQRGHHH